MKRSSKGGAFWGESCLAGQTVRTGTATAMEDSTFVRIGTDAMICVLHEEPAFAELFMVYMLAHFGKEGEPETIIPKISQ
jgi:CRP/FNR family transcriptional regulator, cyclic AMP receptor protein